MEEVQQLKDSIFDVKSQLAVHIANSEGHWREIILMTENLKMQVSHIAELRIDKLEAMTKDHIKDCEIANQDRKIMVRDQAQRRITIWLAIGGAWIAAVGPQVINLLQK